MSRFLFASTPVAAHTTNPLPFAARLIEQGHDVAWYASAAFADRIESIGARHVRMPASIDVSMPEGRAQFEHLLDGDGINQIRRTFAEFFFGTVPTSVRAIQSIVADFPADVMLSDAVMLAPRFVHELGGPVWATYGDGPLVGLDPMVPPFGPGLSYRDDVVGRARNAFVRRAAGRVFRIVDNARDDVRRELGLPPDERPAMDFGASPYLHLQGCTPGFEYPIRNPPKNLHWVGALRPDRPMWAKPEWWPQVAESTLPVVHVSQGSLRSDMTELVVPTVRALAKKHVRVVVTTGGLTAADLELALGGAIPSNVIVAEFVPYDELLPHVDVFVTNGGYTGVTLALAHGVPIVQAGRTEEKAENGARIAYAGVGLALGTTRPSARRVGAAVERVLTNDRFRLAAGHVAAEMAEHDGGREGAKLLAALAAETRSDHGGYPRRPLLPMRSVN